jgi:hypothetical protein
MFLGVNTDLIVQNELPVENENVEIRLLNFIRDRRYHNIIYRQVENEVTNYVEIGRGLSSFEVRYYRYCVIRFIYSFCLFILLFAINFGIARCVYRYNCNNIRYSEQKHKRIYKLFILMMTFLVSIYTYIFGIIFNLAVYLIPILSYIGTSR